MTENLVQAKKSTILDAFKEIPMLFRVLAIIPIVCGVLNGGALGGAIGAGGSFGVIAIAKKGWSTPIKLLSIFGLYVLLSVAALLVGIIVIAVLAMM